MIFYGICRELNKCVCGLCAKIQYGSNKGMALRGRPPIKIKPPKPPKPKPGCDKCGALRLRKDHRCPALQPPKLPKATPVVWPKVRKQVQLHGDPTEPQPCGCILWRGRRIKWCYEDHTPTSHPNASNDISE